MSTSYRLKNRTHTITRGPLALVASQAHRNAAAGRPALIVDDDHNTVSVEPHRGTIWALWQQPAQLQLFTDTPTPRRPDWYDRLLLLLIELNDDGHNELPHHTTQPEKAKL